MGVVGSLRGRYRACGTVHAGAVTLCPLYTARLAVVVVVVVAARVYKACGGGGDDVTLSAVVAGAGCGRCERWMGAEVGCASAVAQKKKSLRNFSRGDFFCPKYTKFK